MHLRKLWCVAMGLAAFGFAMAAEQALAQKVNEQFIPRLVYRTGPYAPNGIPFADGYADYIDMLNARDGGIGGVKLTYEECETAYNNDKGVECYERLKGHAPTGASFVDPLSTGITYAILERTTADKIPLVSMGYGRADASYGEVFPYTFTYPATYWDSADVMITYIAGKEGGMDKLKGKKIALVYHDSAYGKEPISTLEKLSEKDGFTFVKYPVSPPGIDQKATWLQVRQDKPDWVLMWGWGVMNSTAVKEAAGVGYPMDHFIGVWYSGAEPDVVPAGDDAKGYLATTFHGVGPNFPVIQDILKYVYGNGKTGHTTQDKVGEVLYDRGVLNAMYNIEGIRLAQGKYGKKPLTGEQVQWGLEHLDVTDARIKALGAEGLAQPIKISCADHEGGGSVRLIQWDGKKWNVASDWIAPHRDMIRDMYKDSALAYAKEKNIIPRNCSQVSEAR
ncbi:MAG TPA: ABC transporter substrate-binding protein [Stellaceae bacterium]|jgi:branched-chain amino acid transport system substrate-binding protein|nr:ABC transporter substrate-binding protein [Stellaceae bacterium]